MIWTDRIDRLNRERRRHTREPCRVPGLLFYSLGEEACTVIDVSPGGAKIRVDRILERQTPVRLKMTRDGEFAGEVVWISAGTVGLQFNHRPLD